MMQTTDITMIIAKCQLMYDEDDDRHYDDDSKVPADV